MNFVHNRSVSQNWLKIAVQNSDLYRFYGIEAMQDKTALVLYDPVFNVLKLYAQRTNPHTYTNFFLILSRNEVLTCILCFYPFWLLVNKSNIWFLWKDKIYILCNNLKPISLTCHSSDIWISPHWVPKEPSRVQLISFVRLSLCLSVSLSLCMVVRVAFWWSFLHPLIACRACGRRTQVQPPRVAL